jgi:hypothetical protein
MPVSPRSAPAEPATPVKWISRTALSLAGTRLFAAYGRYADRDRAWTDLDAQFLAGRARAAHMRPVRFGVYTAAGCVPWVAGLAWAGYAAGANWQHVQRLVNTPAYIIAGLIALLVIAGIIAVIVRRRKRRAATRPGPAADPVSVGPSEQRRTD